jgi:O-acetyl-ADP-ribose deacetylase (regulator of RNase III)
VEVLMALKFVKGDILDAEDGIIGHQVNCQMVMGSGLAKQIKNKYPRVYDEYIAIVGVAPINTRLGRCQIVAISDVLYFANLFGQFDYGLRGVNTDYGALGMALRQLQRWKTLFKPPNFPVYLPYGIGCGLGGGDWKIVEGIIRDAVPNAIIVRYEKG